MEKQPDILEQFEIWWYNQGSSECFANQINYDNEERTKKICEQSWLIGAETSMQNMIDSNKCTGCMHEFKSVEYINCQHCSRNTSDLYEPIGGFKL